MNLSIYLSEEALQEEIEAFLFYEAEKSGLGGRFLKEVEKVLQKILTIQLTILIQTKQKLLETLVF